MKTFAVLDISMFIWNEDDFNANSEGYYKMVQVITNIYDEITTNKIPVVFRDELILEVFNFFPYTTVATVKTNEFLDFQRFTLSFFSNTTFVPYPEVDNTHIKSSPELNKPYFVISTKNEMRYLITYLYTDRNNAFRLLTFSTVWHNAGNLNLTNGNSIVIEADQCDETSDHKKIISKFKNIFEHNPKHNYRKKRRGSVGKFISALSCYNERVGDTTYAQELLDTSVYYTDDYFNYDKINSTFVKFVLTGGNVYHGYNVQLSEVEQVTINKLIGNE